MVKVTVSNNVKRETVIVDSSKTPREIFEENDIEYGSAMVHMDGASINPGDLDKSLAELGVSGERCYLTAVVKADNG